MKRIFICASIAVFLLSACNKDSFTTGALKESQNTTPNGAAYVYHSTEKVNDESYNWNPCGEEYVHFTGEALITTHYVINGNKISGEYHYNPQGEKGVGLNSGTIYQGVGSINETFSGSFTNGVYVYTYKSRIALVTPGRANNFVYSYGFDLHFTINASGTLAVEKSNVIFACQ